MSGRGFRHEEWFVQVVDWFAVRRDVSEETARQIVEAAEDQLGVEALRSWLPEAHRPNDDAQLRSALVDALADGQLELVKHGRAHEPLRSPTVHNLVDLIESHEEDLPRPPWIEISCLGPGGETYAFSHCRVRMPDGTHRYARLDHRSSLRIDDIPAHGTCHFELSQDAKPDGGRRPTPQPKAIAYEIGAAAAVVTSSAHVLRIQETAAWVELEVVDTRGRPVPHFTAVLRTTEGPLPIELGAGATGRAPSLPDTRPVSATLQADPVRGP